MKRLVLALALISAPALGQSVTIAESAVRDQLRDPDSAQFTWPYGFQYGTFRLGSMSADGWITCGTTNAKNGFGGYAGRSATVVVIRDDQPIVALVERPGFSLLAKSCAKMGMPL